MSILPVKTLKYIYILVPFRIPTYDEIVNEENISEEEEQLEKEEQFERKYNFRYEEPDQEFVSSNCHTLLICSH